MRTVTVRPLERPKPLCCEFWISEHTKCAETATVSLFNGVEELGACPKHIDALTAALTEET